MKQRWFNEIDIFTTMFSLQALLATWPELETKAEKKMIKALSTFVTNVKKVQSDLLNAKKSVKNSADNMMDELNHLVEDIGQERVTPDSLMEGVNKVLGQVEDDVIQCLRDMREKCEKSGSELIREEENIKQLVLKVRQLFNSINDKYALGETEMNVEVKLLSEEEIEEKVQAMCATLDKLLEKDRIVPKAEGVTGKFLTLFTMKDIEKAVALTKPQSTFSVNNLTEEEIEQLKRRLDNVNKGDDVVEEKQNEEFIGLKDETNERQRRKKLVDKLKGSVSFNQHLTKPRVPYHCSEYAAPGTSQEHCKTRKISSSLFKDLKKKWTKTRGEKDPSYLCIQEESKGPVEAVLKDGVSKPSDIAPILAEIPTKWFCPEAECKSSYTTFSTLAIHFNKKHGGKKAQSELQACGMCAKVFTTKTGARNCAKSHFPYESRKSYFCVYCMLDEDQLVIKNTEGHLIDHMAVNHADLMKRPFHACAVCDSDCTTVMRRSMCQNSCLDDEDPRWHCQSCAKDFNSYEDKVAHFHRRHNTGVDVNNHELFRLYLAGFLSEKVEGDDKSTIVVLKKPKRKFAFVNVNGEEGVRCPGCEKLGKKTHGEVFIIANEEEFLKLLKKHYLAKHKDDDPKLWLNEIQQQHYDIL